jgi:hypothetical protein
MINAPVSLNLLDAANSVSGRGQAHVVNYPAREAGEIQAKTGSGLLDTGLICNSVDNA